MSSNHAILFQLKDIIGAFDKFNEVISTSDTIENLSKSPVHILLYNEILKFTKEELESPIPIRNSQTFLYNHIFHQRHGLFFKACFLKGAFKDKLSDETKWLLDSISNPSDQLFEALHYMEKCRRNKGVDNPTELTFSLFIDTLINRYSYSFDTEEKKQVIDLIIDKYAIKESEFLQTLVIKDMPMHENHSVIHEYIGRKLHELGLVTNNLNGLLPHPSDYPDHNSDFNLNRHEVSKIQRILKCGFRFDEENYNYYGDNLFIALVKSKNMNACEVILPYLSDVTPKSGSYTQQHAIIDSLAKTNPNNYKFIQSHYEKCLLNLELAHKPESSEKVRKPKI